MLKKYEPQLVNMDCVAWLQSRRRNTRKFSLTFMDPPFNQGKDYRSHDDGMSDDDYWSWMRTVCELTLEHTVDGGAMYFMQREKNTAKVMQTLSESGWDFQNLIIWKKKTSAVPASRRFGKAFQVIVFATKGKQPQVFNKLRIDPPIPLGYKPRPQGLFVTDIWDDIRELTSGYFAGDEALRGSDGERMHKQQTPIALLLRIILSSTVKGMVVFDPFAGSGTTGIVAAQLERKSVLVELDSKNADLIRRRLANERESDGISRYRDAYTYTLGLDEIWPYSQPAETKRVAQVAPTINGAARCSPRDSTF